MENKSNIYDNRIIYKNSVLSMIYKFLSAFLSIVIAPLLLNILGEAKYGAWVSMLSLISWIYYLDIGIGNGLRNKLSSSIVSDDYFSSRKYLGISYMLMIAITTLVLLIVFIGLLFLDVSGFFGLKFPDENLNIVLFVAILFAGLNFVLSLANNILYALHKASLVSFFSVLGQFFFALLLGIYILTGNRLLLLIAFGEGLCQTIKNIVETIYVFKSNPKLKFTLKDIDWSYSKGIFTFGLQMFIIQIAALILNSTDNLIITKLYGPAAVTPYSFTFKYFGMINTIYVALTTPLLSAYTAAYTNLDYDWIMKTLKRNGFLYLLFLFGTIIAAFIFKPFSIVWLQKDLNIDIGIIFFTSLYFILLMFNHIFSTFITGISKIKGTILITLILTILNIPISVFFARTVGLGTKGVILGSLICVILGIWIAPMIAYRELRKLKNIRKI